MVRWAVIFWLIGISMAGTGCRPAAEEAGVAASRLSGETARSNQSAAASLPSPGPSSDAADATPSSERPRGDERTSVPDERTEEAGLPLDLLPAGKEDLLAARRQRNQTVWRDEVLAQQYEQAFVRLWDALLAEDRKPDGDKFAVFSQVGFRSLLLGALQGEPKQLDWGVRVWTLGASSRPLQPEDWVALLEQWREQGYRLVQSEWHHAAFQPAEGSEPARSTVAMVLYVQRNEPETRWVVQGNLQIVWQLERDRQGMPVPEHIDATNMTILERSGPPAYQEILTVDHTDPTRRSGVQPVVLYDLNGDGRSEIVLAGANTIYWNRGEGQFEQDRLFAHPEKIFEAGLLADVTGDGHPDFLVPAQSGDLLLYEGNEAGRFLHPPLGKARGGGPLVQPQVLTAGDIDNDGDLDVWVGQYKISYVQGQMPTPYYDANDGFPAYLLLNDGQGRFTPATEEAGLAPKRFRRSYGGSFVDLDEDADLDLLVVSDFAGIDVYQNDGTGYFHDKTDQWVDERHLFGMAATFADYNLDGRLDFFVTGMASTTARRLERMKLGRRDRPDVHLMRSRMAYGNRMYLAHSEGFAQPSFRDQVARTGWTWGATSLDFDNDGDPDIFVANGHSSGESTKDHCTHFWCHDIYDASSTPDRAVHEMFQEVLQGYMNRSESWDGYQKNVLLMNQQGEAFTNIGFLMGVGQQYDGRAAISDDLDGDGRLDLIVVEDQWRDGQILHVYRNCLPTEHHWIGIRLHDQPAAASPLGAKVLVKTADRLQVRAILAGDSIHAQHAPVAHFGLGQTAEVQWLEVRWPNGQQVRVERPAVNQYHVIRAPAEAAGDAS